MIECRRDFAYVSSQAIAHLPACSPLLALVLPAWRVVDSHRQLWSKFQGGITDISYRLVPANFSQPTQSKADHTLVAAIARIEYRYCAPCNRTRGASQINAEFLIAGNHHAKHYSLRNSDSFALWLGARIDVVRHCAPFELADFGT